MSRLNTTIEIYRQQGFFSSIGNDASEIAQVIIEKSQSSYFGDILNLDNEPLYEQIVLSYDIQICWFIEDINAYYLSDEVNPEMYIEVFNRLSLISKGLFLPQNIDIKECGYCEGRDKRIKLDFLFEKKEKSLIFCADGWSLILGFLDEINLFIKDTAHSFEYIIDNYGVCFVFFINQKQKEFLTEELNWNFISKTSYWVDKALYYNEINNPIKAEECFKKAIYNGNNINSFVKYAGFLKEQRKYIDALDVLEKGKILLDNPKTQMTNPEWWKEFILNQINEISVILNNN